MKNIVSKSCIQFSNVRRINWNNETINSITLFWVCRSKKYLKITEICVTLCINLTDYVLSITIIFFAIMHKFLKATTSVKVDKDNFPHFLHFRIHLSRSLHSLSNCGNTLWRNDGSTGHAIIVIINIPINKATQN